MTGTVRLKTKFDLPPGDADLSDRLYLTGRFEVIAARFSNDKIQGRVDALSMRSQGKPQLATDDVPDNVKSRLGGDFVLKNSDLILPNLVFQMPGTKVILAGDYSLDGEPVRFPRSRTLRCQAVADGSWMEIHLPEACGSLLQQEWWGR
jgi:hypothetical protein